MFCYHATRMPVGSEGFFAQDPRILNMIQPNAATMHIIIHHIHI